MISVSLALRLRDAGVGWDPRPGDRFVIPDRGMDDDVFVLSDMTVELHEHRSGPFIGFNGTTEWALDSVAQREALWLPAEHQLRELLGGTFRSLSRTGGVYVVETSVADRTQRATHRSAAEAYGLALRALAAEDPPP